MSSFITQFGVLGVFLLMVPESACIPVPSEATLILAGVAVHQGWMSLPLAVAAATAGNLLGSLLAYGLGASGLLGNVPIARGAIRRWGEMIERHGVKAVFFARLLPLARTFVALPAGARRVALVPFTACTVVGSAIWAVAFIVVGMLASNAWHTIDSWLGRGLLVVGVLVLLWILHEGGGHRDRRDPTSERGHRARWPLATRLPRLRRRSRQAVGWGSRSSSENGSSGSDGPSGPLRCAGEEPSMLK